MENTTKNNKITPKMKKGIIIASAGLGALIIVLCAVLLLTPPSQAGEPVELEGVYSIAINGIGGSSYTFRADGSGVRTYFAEEVENTEEFSYVVTDKTITFNWKDSGKTDSHSFEYGTMGKVDVIFINEVTYYKQ